MAKKMVMPKVKIMVGRVWTSEEKLALARSQAASYRAGEIKAANPTMSDEACIAQAIKDVDARFEQTGRYSKSS